MNRQAIFIDLEACNLGFEAFTWQYRWESELWRNRFGEWPTYRIGILGGSQQRR